MTRPRRGAHGRPPAGPPRSLPQAMRYVTQDQAPAPAAMRASSIRGGPDLRARSLAGTLRMAQLHAPVKCGDAAIAGRLVKHRIALDRGGKGFRVTLLLDL